MSVRPTFGHTSPMPVRLLLASALALAAILLAPTAASAGPVAKTPAFTGGTPRVKTGAPKTGAGATPRAPIGLTGALSRPTPHVAVDDAGTAYIAWLEATDPTSGTEGGIGFCRLPRGATACDNPQATRLLRPGKQGYGLADDPAYNQDAGGGAFPVVVGDQLFILTSRSVTTYATPAGDSTLTTIAFVSTDAGSSFSAGQPVATGLAITTKPVAFGPDDNPLIGLMGGATDNLVGGGGRFLALQGGTFATEVIDLPDAQSAALAALPGGGIALGYDTPAGGVVRRSPSPARPTADGAFGAPQRVAGRLAGIGAGPKGLAAIGIGGASAALNERVVATPLDGGSPLALTKDSAASPVLAASGGPLVAGYKDVGDPTSANGFYTRRSANGATYTAAERLTTAAEGVFSPDIAAAPDGGGVAVWQTEDGGGAVHATVFGPQGKLTAPGLPGSTPGSGGTSKDSGITRECSRIAVGAIEVRTADGVGCFLPGIGANKGKSVSNGAVLYNGLRITPLNGSQIVLDINAGAKTVTMYTTGQATVEIPGGEAGDILIFRGQLKQKLTAKVGEPALDLPKFPTTIRGFKVANQLAPLATKGGGVKIPADLDLGPQFFHLTGHADLIVTPAGLQLDTLRFRQGTLPLGPVTVRDLDVSWTREANLWSGSGKIELPGGGVLGLAASFDSTSFSATATYDLAFPGIQLFATPPVYLHQISAGLAVNRTKAPLTIDGGVKIGAVPIGPGVYLLDLVGTVGLQFGSPFVMTARGDLELLSALNVASASLRAGTDGIVTADFSVGLIDKDWAYVGATVKAGVSSAGFEGKGAGELCVGIKLVSYCADLPEGYVSSKGIAGCASILGKARTVSYTWGGPMKRRSGPTCFYEDISIGLIRGRGTPRQATRGLTLDEPADVLSINLQTAEGAPQVDLIDPSGAAVPLDAPNVSFASSTAAHAATIEVTNAAAGTWNVISRGPALTGMDASVPAPAPKVTGSVSKARRGTRTARYSISGNDEASVALVERTRRGDVPLKTPGTTAGSVRFRPNAEVAGRHQIVARIAGPDGFVVAEKVLGSFVQPPPARPRRPARVRARRSGAKILVAVTRARGSSDRVLVTARYGEGGRASAVIPAGKRSVRLPGPPRSLDAPGSVRIRVAALSRAGKAGPSRQVTVGVRAGQRSG